MANNSDPTYRITEVVGTSGESLHQAVRNGVATAAETVRNLDWFEVSDIRGTIEGNDVGRFQVTLRIGFRVERD